jgi:uncharacterized protein (DUF58 family)
MMKRLSAWLRARFARWADARSRSPSAETTLDRGRIYILPTRAGLSFALMLLVLLVGSINYNLGLGYALTFLLGTCALVDMVLTWRNLAQLRMRAQRANPVFAGQEAAFDIQVANPTGRERYAVQLDLADRASPRHALDLAPNGSLLISMSAHAPQRGWLAAPRLCVRTSFPLGLFRAWSYWQPSARALVYPQPEPHGPALPEGGGGAQGPLPGRRGDEDFDGIRNYQPGDSLRHLAWRQIARLGPEQGGHLLTKQFAASGGTQLTLDFDALPATLDIEHRLARMAHWVLQAERLALPYAFRKGSLRLEPACGPAQQAASLRALALHGLPEEHEPVATVERRAQAVQAGAPMTAYAGGQRYGGAR